MLEGVAVVAHIVIVVVGIGEEAVAAGEDVTCRQVRRREHSTMRIGDFKDFLGVVVQVLSQLVAQVGIRILVALHADGVLATNAAVVRSEDDVVVALCQGTEEITNSRVAEPTECDAAVGCFIGRQLTHHPTLGAGMAEHIDEVEHAHIDIVLRHLWQLLHQTFSGSGVVHLIISKGMLATVALEERLDEGRLVEVLALLRVFIHPQVGKHLCDDVWHQS